MGPALVAFIAFFAASLQLSRAIHFTNAQWDVRPTQDFALRWAFDSGDIPENPGAWSVVVWVDSPQNYDGPSIDGFVYNETYAPGVTSWNYDPQHLAQGDWKFGIAVWNSQLQLSASSYSPAWHMPARAVLNLQPSMRSRATDSRTLLSRTVHYYTTYNSHTVSSGAIIALAIAIPVVIVLFVAAILLRNQRRRATMQMISGPPAPVPVNAPGRNGEMMNMPQMESDRTSLQEFLANPQTAKVTAPAPLYAPPSTYR